VVVAIEGVVNVEPVPRGAPPVAAAYQDIISPGFAVADKVVVPVPQRVSPVVETN
jgi:hypothetical protein